MGSGPNSTVELTQLKNMCTGEREILRKSEKGDFGSSPNLSITIPAIQDSILLSEDLSVNSFDAVTLLKLQQSLAMNDRIIGLLKMLLALIVAAILLLLWLNKIHSDSNIVKLDLFETTFAWYDNCMNIRTVASIESCESHFDEILLWYE